MAEIIDFASRVETEEVKEYPIYLASKAKMLKMQHDKTIKKYHEKEFEDMVEKLGGSRSDFLVVQIDGKWIGYVEEGIGRYMMESLADMEVEKGKWTPEEAEEYLQNGSEE